MKITEKDITNWNQLHDILIRGFESIAVCISLLIGGAILIRHPELLPSFQLEQRIIGWITDIFAFALLIVGLTLTSIKLARLQMNIRLVMSVALLYVVITGQLVAALSIFGIREMLEVLGR